jgi:hypothetical protein
MAPGELELHSVGPGYGAVEIGLAQGPNNRTLSPDERRPGPNNCSLLAEWRGVTSRGWGFQSYWRGGMADGRRFH